MRAGAAAVTLHPAHRSQGFGGKATVGHIGSWPRLQAAVPVPVFGSGDLFTAAGMPSRWSRDGLDAVMIARGCAGQPFHLRGNPRAARGPATSASAPASASRPPCDHLACWPRPWASPRPAGRCASTSWPTRRACREGPSSGRAIVHAATIARVPGDRGGATWRRLIGTRCARACRPALPDAQLAGIDALRPGVFHWHVEERSDAIRHHCGVMGISSAEEANIPELLFYGLFSLQHRGQESAGIAYHRHGRIVSYRRRRHGGERPVPLPRGEPPLAGGHRPRALLHPRHQQARERPADRRLLQQGRDLPRAQRQHLQLRRAHPGADRRRAPSSRAPPTRSCSCTSSPAPRVPDFREALVECLGLIEGAYCFLMMHDDTLVRRARPPRLPAPGDRAQDGQVMVASETCALGLFQARGHPRGRAGRDRR